MTTGDARPEASGPLRVKFEGTRREKMGTVDGLQLASDSIVDCESFLWTSQRLEGTLQSLMNFVPHLIFPFPPIPTLRKNKRGILWGSYLHCPRLRRNVIAQRQARELETGLRALPFGQRYLRSWQGESRPSNRTPRRLSLGGQESLVKWSAFQSYVEVLSIYLKIHVV